MNIYLSGQGQFAYTVAEALSGSGHRIVGVAAPRTRSRCFDDTDSAAWDRLRVWAYPRNITWTYSADLRAVHVPDDTDVIVAAHSHAFVGRHTRARARVASIGYHPSLLPLHRGRDAVRWTVRDGDRVTGGTVYHLTERTDAGPIAAQEHMIIPRGVTVTELWRDHLAPLGVYLLQRVVADLARGRRVEVPQNEALASWEPSMASAPLAKPELPELPGALPVLGSAEALYSA